MRLIICHTKAHGLSCASYRGTEGFKQRHALVKFELWIVTIYNCFYNYKFELMNYTNMNAQREFLLTT